MVENDLMERIQIEGQSRGSWCGGSERKNRVLCAGDSAVSLLGYINYDMINRFMQLRH